jgi:hypothetical protein
MEKNKNHPDSEEIPSGYNVSLNTIYKLRKGKMVNYSHLSAE